MNGNRLLGDIRTWHALAKRLAKCTQVSQYDTAEHIEAETIVHAFADLEESFRVFVDQKLPRLVQPDELNQEETVALLLEICDEFRHILYHIRDSKFYSHLLEPLEHP